jgi:hypothetical protein
MLPTLLLEYTVAAVRKLYKCQIGERLFTFDDFKPSDSPTSALRVPRCSTSHLVSPSSLDVPASNSQDGNP